MHSGGSSSATSPHPSTSADNSATCLICPPRQPAVSGRRSLIRPLNVPRPLGLRYVCVSLRYGLHLHPPCRSCSWARAARSVMAAASTSPSSSSSRARWIARSALLQSGPPATRHFIDHRS